MSLEQEYLLCWQAEMSARRLRAALGALRNVHDDFRPCQEVHDAVADYLRSAERAASERGHHYKWLTGGKKYTSPREIKEDMKAKGVLEAFKTCDRPEAS